LTAQLVTDADGYEREIRGAAIRSIRTGKGVGPNRVAAVSGGVVDASGVTVGFPMLNRTTIGDDQVLLGSVGANPAGSRWCGVDLEPRMLAALGPGVEHTGLNRVGLSFSFVAMKLSVLEEWAEELHIVLHAPPTGRFQTLHATSEARRLPRRLAAFLRAEDPSGISAGERGLLALAVGCLEGERRGDVGGGRRIDTRRVTAACIEYAETIGRVPAISDLCLAAHVSERSLRAAFQQEYGLSPSRFFRAWGLEKARQRLRRAPPEPGLVTRTAFDLGFDHLGRFAARYRNQYGEMPSQTLAT
jgi:AraC-like DNA-binding protein